MSEERIKHLEFIQNVVTRMNSNCFHLKAWAVTIVSALLAIYASTQNTYFVLVAVFPCIPLWLLDSYYLAQERRFRGLYEDVAGVPDAPNSVKPFAMSTAGYSGGRYSMWSTARSGTEAGLYLPLLLGLLTAFFYLLFGATGA